MTVGEAAGWVGMTDQQLLEIGWKFPTEDYWLIQVAILGVDPEAAAAATGGIHRADIAGRFGN